MKKNPEIKTYLSRLAGTWKLGKDVKPGYLPENSFEYLKFDKEGNFEEGVIFEEEHQIRIITKIGKFKIKDRLELYPSQYNSHMPKVKNLKYDFMVGRSFLKLVEFKGAKNDQDVLLLSYSKWLS